MKLTDYSTALTLINEAILKFGDIGATIKVFSGSLPKSLTRATKSNYIYCTQIKDQLKADGLPAVDNTILTSAVYDSVLDYINSNVCIHDDRVSEENIQELTSHLTLLIQERLISLLSKAIAKLLSIHSRNVSSITISNVPLPQNGGDTSGQIYCEFDGIHPHASGSICDGSDTFLTRLFSIILECINTEQNIFTILSKDSSINSLVSYWQTELAIDDVNTVLCAFLRKFSLPADSIQLINGVSTPFVTLNQQFPLSESRIYLSVKNDLLTAEGLAARQSSMLVGTALNTVINSINYGSITHDSSGTSLVSSSIIDSLIEETNNALDSILEGYFGFDTALIGELSCKTYEGELAKGNLVFLSGDQKLLTALSSDILLQVDSSRMTSPISFNRGSLKAIRKYLEGCGNNALLFFRDENNLSSEYVFKGYLSQKRLKTIPLFFRIDGLMRWSIHSGSSALLTNEHNFYTEPTTPLVTAIEKLKHYLEKIPSDQHDLFNSFIELLSRQKHGTSVIFLDGSKPKARQRLETLVSMNRALQASPLKLQKNDPSFEASVISISRIDGAWIVDTAIMSVTHLSVILDGDAVAPSSLSRGARYSSVVNFVEHLHQADNTIAICGVICSEDGDIDVIYPNT